MNLLFYFLSFSYSGYQGVWLDEKNIIGSGARRKFSVGKKPPISFALLHRQLLVVAWNRIDLGATDNDKKPMNTRRRDGKRRSEVGKENREM